MLNIQISVYWASDDVNKLTPEPVLIQLRDNWYPAKVTKVSQNTPRSYIVTTSQGKTYRRNRRQLRKIPNKYMYQILVGKHSEDKRYDEAYDEYYDENMNDNTTGDNPSCSSEANTLQSASLSPPLRRSQRTIRKPVRYADPHY